MNRKTKAKHQEVLSTKSSFTGQVAATFSSPREIAKRNRLNMTAAEYVELKMPGRRVGQTTRRDVAVSRMQARRTR